MLNELDLKKKVVEFERQLRAEMDEAHARMTFTDEQRRVLEHWRKDYRRIFEEAGLDMFRISEGPNRYLGDRVWPHMPAVTVMTQIGAVEFWWRKSVCVISWAGSLLTKPGHELFPNCPDTTGDYYVHCWTYEKAIERMRVVRLAGEEALALIICKSEEERVDGT